MARNHNRQRIRPTSRPHRPHRFRRPYRLGNLRISPRLSHAESPATPATRAAETPSPAHGKAAPRLRGSHSIPRARSLPRPPAPHHRAAAPPAETAPRNSAAASPSESANNTAHKPRSVVPTSTRPRSGNQRRLRNRIPNRLARATRLHRRRAHPQRLVNILVKPA